MRKTLFRCILIFLLIAICLLLADLLLLQGVLARDFLSLFIHEEMSLERILGILGQPLRDIGSGGTVLEWPLPFGHFFYVTSAGNTVLHCFITENNFREVTSYPLHGMLLPLLLLLIAAAEIAAVCLIRKFKRK